MIIEIEKTLVSSQILEKEFLCNLKACKGICCIEGDSGAPLEDDELKILEEEYKNIAPFLREEGKKAIEEQGLYIKDEDDEWVTPLVENAECAYVTFSDDGTAKCGIEQAQEAGKLEWKKPISCHLYPIRITKYEEFDAVNYHSWPICDDACTLGKEMGLKVYRFLKEPLTLRFGSEWYAALEAADASLIK